MNMVSPQMTGQLREINTTSLGQIQYAEEQRFVCPSGLLGFEQQQCFILVDDVKVSPFQWLQNEDDGEMAFLIISPTTVRPSYQLSLDRSSLEDLSIEDSNETNIFVIATLANQPQDTTLNFKGPLVFNVTKRLIQQVIDEEEELKAPLFPS
jgi:flagellar assembly factor FliW